MCTYVVIKDLEEAMNLLLEGKVYIKSPFKEDEMILAVEPHQPITLLWFKSKFENNDLFKKE